jgi:peptidoglycan hydrolase-like protein with peptidoglycan-binding domain
VTSGGRACSTFAHCAELLAAGEDIDYDGTTGHLAIDDVGDVSTARVTTARVIDGQLQPIAHQDIDLVAQRQDAVFAASVFVTQLQQALRVLGYYDGEVTGIYDDATTAAVGALQTDLGLPATGQYDSATDAALRERIGARLATIGTGIAELQQALADRGYYQGPIDGRFNDATVAAIKAFQTDLGVPPTGIIDVATLRAIYARGVASGELLVPPPPEPTTPPKPPAPTTVPAPTVAPTAPEPPPTAAPATTTAPTPTTDAPSEPADPPDTIEPPVTGPDLYDALSSDARFSTFIELARIAGYDHDLSQLGPFTVFAPTDDAFEALDPDELEELRTDPAAANALLRDLIVEDRIAGVDLRSGPLRTIGGGSIEIATGAGGTTAGGAQVSADAIEASNGVVHALATVPTSG